MKKLLLPVFFLTVIAFGQPLASRADDSPAITAAKAITSGEAARLLADQPDEYILVDVRTPAEFAEGHIKGAKNIDFFGPNFETEMAKLPKDKSLMIYCRTGKRSAAAADILKESGRENVVDITDGLEGWKKGDRKLEKETEK